MKHGRIVRADDDSCIVPQALCTTHMLDRMRGLLGRAPLNAQQALLITPCNSVHTLAMTYALDLVYLRRDGSICKLVRALSPWRVSICSAAATVIEMRAGRIDELGLESGQILRWENE